LGRDDAVVDKLSRTFPDVNLVSTTWFNIWPVVVANRRSNDGSV
jgi:hypothetical protein